MTVLAVISTAGFRPSTWELVAVSVPSVVVGCWAVWDAWRPPKIPVFARIAMLISLVSLVQWTGFLVMRATGLWDAITYEVVAAPYRLLVLSPVGGWGIWFTMHWFDRRRIRHQRITGGAPGTTDSGGRLGD